VCTRAGNSGSRALPESSKGLRQLRPRTYADAGGRQPLIHYESLGLKTPDHDVNVVSSFHPPPFV
jgi:hypothetical protein